MFDTTTSQSDKSRAFVAEAIGTNGHALNHDPSPMYNSIFNVDLGRPPNIKYAGIGSLRMWFYCHLPRHRALGRFIRDLRWYIVAQHKMIYELRNEIAELRLAALIEGAGDD